MKECFISSNMLFTKYNPYYYQKLINEIEDEINDMYTLTMPTTFIDEAVGLLRIGSYRIEDLTINIIERKERLERLKNEAYKHCMDLQKALSNVPTKYQYMLTNAQITGNKNDMNKAQLESICTALWKVVCVKNGEITSCKINYKKKSKETLIQTV
ncbi:hypothetical protein NGB24_07150 [Mammaliicoccus vitulinus]|uniref:hypothetical protein n=1 Tax=Mammaliicoccus vitulinus TaxID=71237 RepID=UPI002DBD9280|nr:hypothetical protein [Mammaliicoccus vitulinus]MEB7657629.1 hypothetical protein [Mammaliicoccus vitulinus]